MSIVDEAKVAGWAAKNILLLVLAGLAVLALFYVGYAVFIAPQNARNETATATATGAVSAAGAASGHDAIQTVNARGITEKTIHDTVRIDHETIIHEPGASVLVSPELDAAGRHAVCMHDSAAVDPVCKRLLQPGP